MILTVYLSDGEQAVTEVPITPETTCRDVVEFCKEPGESGCHLAEVWRGNGKRRQNHIHVHLELLCGVSWDGPQHCHNRFLSVNTLVFIIALKLTHPCYQHFLLTGHSPAENNIPHYVIVFGWCLTIQLSGPKIHSTPVPCFVSLLSSSSQEESNSEV